MNLLTRGSGWAKQELYSDDLEVGLMTRAAWLGWQLQHSLCFASDVCDLEQYQKTRVVPAVDPGSVY